MRRMFKLSLTVMFLFAFVSATFAANVKATDEKATAAFYERIIQRINELEQKAPQCKEDLSTLKAEFDNLYLATTSENEVTTKKASAPRVRKATGGDMYSNCEGLEDESLKRALRGLVNNHHPVNYQQAQDIVFGQLDNYNGVVECVYTGRKIQTVGEPDSTDMNIEHSWPQSKGAKGIAKCDLHHLFPADAKANGLRGNHPFGYARNVSWEQGGSKFDNTQNVFEIRKEQRGNTARGMFYFSIRYNMPIDPKQEKVLREWNRQDPVDEKERKRNDKIQNIQNNRNPFVDHPEFVDRISDF